MKKLLTKDGFDFYRYNPSILKPFYINMEPLTVKRRIRLLLAYFSGFCVYYIGQSDQIVGYCLVQNGKDRRYYFADEKDIIVGPYFIRDDYRGRKLSVTLLDFILNDSDEKFRYAYDYIHRDNIPSIKASEAVGFHYYRDANISNFSRSIKTCNQDEGEYLILKYSND